MARRRDEQQEPSIFDDLPERLRRFVEDEWLDVAAEDPTGFVGGSAVPRWRRYQRLAAWVTARHDWAGEHGLDVTDPIPDETEIG